MSFCVTLPGAALAAAAGWAAALAPARSDPALAGVLIVAEDFSGTCSFSATDHNTTGQITLRDAEVTGQGRRLVSARLLADIARTVAKEPRVSLAEDDTGGRLNVSAGPEASWSLPLMPVEDYPRLPSPAAAVARVDAAAFTRAISRVSLALSEPVVKPFCGGILLDGGDGTGPLSVVSGSGWRIAVIELDWAPALNEALAAPGFPSVLVPAQVLSAAIAAAREVDGDDEVTLHTDGATFAVTGSNYHVIGRLIGDPPDRWQHGDMITKLQHVIAHVDVATDALKTALDRVAVVHEAHEAIQLEITEDAIAVSFSGAKKGQAAHVVEVLDFAGTPCTYGLNLGYIRDLLACLGTEKVRLQLLGKPHAPMTLARAVDDAGEVVGDARVSLAPIRLKTATASAA